MDIRVYHDTLGVAIHDFREEKDHKRRKLLAHLVRHLCELTGTALPTLVDTWFKARTVAGRQWHEQKSSGNHG